MADPLAPVDLGRALGNRPLKRDLHTARLAAEAAAPLPPGAEQVAVKLEGLTFRDVDELVDRLVAQARAVAGELEPAGDRRG